MTSIGQRIRFYRMQIHMTAKDLAEKMSVSPSTISKIENSRIAPSMEMLQKISSSLNVPTGQLFIEGKTDNFSMENYPSPIKIVKKNERRKLILFNSDIEYLLLSPSFHGRTELAIMELMPGQNSGAPKHHPIGEEFIFILEGCLKLNLDGKDFILEEGDSVTLDATIPHSYSNESNSKTVVISGNTPPVF